MSLREDMDHLQIAIHDLSQGVNALEVMTLGLLSGQDPYAKGFSALSTYLTEADRKVQECLSICLNTI